MPLRQPCDRFRSPRELRWNEFADRNQVKLAFNQVEKLPGSVRDILYFMNGRPMLEFLQTLTGINGVIPDPYYLGAGLHQIKRGGYLEIHADKLDRRLNVLIYMNKDWREEYGGHFEPWNKEMTGPVVKIAPPFQSLRYLQHNFDFVSWSSHTTGLSTRTHQEVDCYLLPLKWPS